MTSSIILILQGLWFKCKGYAMLLDVNKKLSDLFIGLLW